MFLYSPSLYEFISSINIYLFKKESKEEFPRKDNHNLTLEYRVRIRVISIFFQASFFSSLSIIIIIYLKS